MPTAAHSSTTARKRSNTPSMRPAANSTASSVNLSAELASYPQISQTRPKIRNAKNRICLLSVCRDRHKKGYSTNLHILRLSPWCDWQLAAHALCLSVIPCTLPPLSQQSQNHVTSKNTYSPSGIAPFGRDLAAVRLLQIIDILATHPNSLPF